MEPIEKPPGELTAEVVAESVLAEAEAEKARKLAGVREIQRRVAAMPNVGPLFTDGDLYDEDGLPC
jgi:hypothetical protein